MSPTILLIEDNEQNRYLATYRLERHGFMVVAAHDGLSGIDALRHTPIIAVTSYAMVGDRERALDAGCTGYMEKPINPETFAAEVAGYGGV